MPGPAAPGLVRELVIGEEHRWAGLGVTGASITAALRALRPQSYGLTEGPEENGAPTFTLGEWDIYVADEMGQVCRPDDTVYRTIYWTARQKGDSPQTASRGPITTFEALFRGGGSVGPRDSTKGHVKPGWQGLRQYLLDYFGQHNLYIEPA